LGPTAGAATAECYGRVGHPPTFKEIVMKGLPMSISGIDGLIKDIEFSFILPSVGFVLALINIRLTPRSKYNGLKLRFVLIAVILLFICELGTLMFQDRAVLIAIWLTFPMGYTCFYCVCTLIIIAALLALIKWKLSPARWKNSSEG
jgi:hypothetical protein